MTQVEKVPYSFTVERAAWPLTREDFVAYSQLLYRLSPTRRVTYDALPRLLGSSCDIVLFARAANGTLVGTARLHIKYEAEGVSGHIDDVVVADAYTRKGIARKLVSDLIRRAKDERVLWLELTSNKHRVAAHSLYESLGFKVYDTIVRIYEE